MSKILVPIDFSDFNREVIQKAIDYAKMSKGEIHLIHVANIDLGVIVSDTGFTYLPELENTVLNEEAEKLTELKEWIESENIICKTIIKQGIPADLILEEAKTLKVDVIIIGSLGHNSLYDIFIGSVAKDVVKHSTVPVLVIPKVKEKQ